MTALAPLRPCHMGPRGIILEKRADGVQILRASTPLRAYPRCVTERLLYWAERTPDAIAFAQRDPLAPTAHRWMTLTYRQFVNGFCRIGRSLLERTLSAQRPIVILSENDFENALLHFAAMHVGIPYIPVSPNYSLLSDDFTKLREILGQTKPGLIFASDGARYGKAVLAAAPHDSEIVFGMNIPRDAEGRRVTRFSALMSTVVSPAVDEAFRNVSPDSVAKILFTSGSTGTPKGVMMTQRHVCSNYEHNVQILPFLEDHPPVLVDWMPWHHVFGGTYNIGAAVWNGGAYYIDRGKPLPGEIESTVQALREIAPTCYLNVPKGIQLLLPYLRNEPHLRKTFFSRLEFIQYGAASFPAHIWDAVDELAVQETGQRILVSAGLGMTECGPTMVFANWEPPGRQPIIGIPTPGVEAKLTPVGEKLEIRFKAPCVTIGYWKDEALTQAAFDEDGYFKTGDAVRFFNPAEPEQGLMFDGRVSEDFKLLSGSWVNVMTIRNALVALFTPYAFDVVIAGHNQDYVSALVFPWLDACRGLCPDLPITGSPEEIVNADAVRAHFQHRLNEFWARGTGGTTRVARIILDALPPTLGTGEMADKGTVAQRMVLERRAVTIRELYEPQPSARTIVAGSGTK
jgi:feruloyl-CoA synthase